MLNIFNAPFIPIIHNLNANLRLNDVNVAVLTRGSHNYDDNTNQTIIQLAMKFINDTQPVEN